MLEPRWDAREFDTSEDPFVPFNGGLSCGVPKKKNTHVLEESVLKALIGTLKL